MQKFFVLLSLVCLALGLVGCSDGDSDAESHVGDDAGSIITVSGTVDDSVDPATMSAEVTVSPIAGDDDPVIFHFSATRLENNYGGTDSINGKWKGEEMTGGGHKVSIPKVIGLIGFPGAQVVPAHGNGDGHGDARVIEMHLHTHMGALVGHYGDSVLFEDFNPDLAYLHPHPTGASQPVGFYNFLSTSGPAPAWNQETKAFSFTINTNLTLGDDELGDGHNHHDEEHVHEEEGDEHDGHDHAEEGDGHDHGDADAHDGHGEDEHAGHDHSH